MSGDPAIAPREASQTKDRRNRVVLPRGRHYDLPGRGRTFARVLQAPPGAPTILLLHGWTATADLNWYSSYAALEGKYGLVALDHRGHGRGIRSSRPFRLTDCADDAVALLDELGIEKVVAVGYSMGGPIAQLIWRRHPKRVVGLVMCATAASFSTTRQDQVRFAVIGTLAKAARVIPKTLRQLIGSQLLTGKSGRDLRQWAVGELRRHDPLKLIQAGHRIGLFDSRRWLRTIDVPVAAVVTKNDEVISVARQRAMLEVIPGATWHDIVGGHTVCVGQPEIFREALLAAISDVLTKSGWTEAGSR
ncbi:MAG: alpha/beta hydrolase [Acidimicrobiales bacterium]|nr:alpha/beta hydrolase [Acidimicrobiales bacterium]